MKLTQKALSAGLAVLMAASLGACKIGGDTTWIAKTDGMTIPAGVYLWEMLNAYYDVSAAVGEDVADPLKEQVEGVPADQKIMEDAKQKVNEYIAVEQRFAEMGLTLDAATVESIPQNVDAYWMYIGSSYEKNGISKDSYTKMFENDAKRTKLFQSIYGEGGEKEVPESELRAKFESDYAKIIVIPLDFSTSTDAAEKERVDQETRDLIDRYLERAQAGEDMEELAYEAEKEVREDDTLEKPEPGTSYTFVNKDVPIYEESVMDAIFAAEIGVPTVAESETGIYLFVRYDVNADENDFESRKSGILSQLKYEEFNNEVAEWGKSISGVTYNEAALKRYTPKKLKV